MSYLFTSESVSEGHPDKICDQISDAVLDAILTQDRKARVACETMVTTGLALSAGKSPQPPTSRFLTSCARSSGSLGQASGGPSLTPFTAHLRILYNPDLIDLWFFVPGMIAMLLQTQTIILTALAVVREREVGTIEQVLVTPIRPVELMLGKTLPNLLLAVINLLSIIAIGTLGFGVPFQGDFMLFFWLTLLYIISGLGLGLLISSISQNQQQAQQLAMMTMLLGMIISGFVFPQYSMPAALRWVSYIFPLTAFIPIARGVFMKGIGLPFLANQVLFLIVYDVVILIFAARLFRQRLD